MLETLNRVLESTLILTRLDEHESGHKKAFGTRHSKVRP